MDQTEIARIFISKDDTEIDGLIKKLEGLGQYEHEKFLDLLIEACGNKDTRLRPRLINMLERYFTTTSALTAHNHASNLLLCAHKNLESSLPIFILRLVLFNTQIMSATKLRELVKTHFTSLHRKLLEKGSGKRVQQNSAHLIVCIFYTLQVELNYFDDVNREDLINIWKSVMDAKAAEKSLIYQLANVIFSASSASAGEVLIHGLDDLLSLNDHENGREQDLLHDYSYIVFDFSRVHLNALAYVLKQSQLEMVLRFIIRVAIRNGLLEEFLKNDFLHDPQLRYGLNSQKTLDALISVCESEGIKTSKFLPIPPNAGRSIETPPVSDFQTIRSAFLHHLKGDEFKKCWKLSFSLYKQNREEFQDFLVNLKSEKINSLIGFLSSAETGPFLESDKRKMKVLRILNFISDCRQNVTVKLHPVFISLMITESGLKIESLNLSARLIEANHQPFTLVPDLISISFSFFQPVFRRLKPGSSAFLALDEVLPFVLAELNFLRVAIRFASNVLSSQFHIVAGLLPDIFQTLTIFKHENYDKSDKLEHALSTVCNSILKQRKIYHKLVPFIIANSLTGERELSHPMYLLLSACDDNDLAFLSTNLWPQSKLKFSLLQSQFYKCNKIIG